MRVLVLPAGTEKGQKLIEEFRSLGHDVWGADSTKTEGKMRNFIKVNPINFEALSLALRLANPEEVHYVKEESLLRNVHVILASSKVRKFVVYGGGPFIEELVGLFSRAFLFKYEMKDD